MGLITDKDVEEAEQAVNLDVPYLKKDKKIDFLNGFVEAWRKTRKSGPSLGPQLNKETPKGLTPQEILRYLNDGIEKEALNYGRAFGTLVGTIEFFYKNPENLFRQGSFEWVVIGINAVKPKPHFYQMAMQRFDVLSNRIKLEQLTAEQRKIYGAIITNLK